MDAQSMVFKLRKGLPPMIYSNQTLYLSVNNVGNTVTVAYKDGAGVVRKSADYLASKSHVTKILAAWPAGYKGA